MRHPQELLDLKYTLIFLRLTSVGQEDKPVVFLLKEKNVFFRLLTNFDLLCNDSLINYVDLLSLFQSGFRVSCSNKIDVCEIIHHFLAYSLAFP